LVGAEYDALKTGTNSKKRPKVYRPAVSFNATLLEHLRLLLYIFQNPKKARKTAISDLLKQSLIKPNLKTNLDFQFFSC
jgi:hypothetical protein